MKPLLAAAATLIPVLLYAYAEGPDAGVAGVPGEATCSACHSGGGATGNVAVSFPGGLSYTPGVKQHLVVTITDAAAKRWGFQLTARLAGKTTTQAGTFAPSDGNTQLVCTQTSFQTEIFGNTCSSSYPVQYIEHTLSGTRPNTKGPVTFAFDWTPPTATNLGSINIYVAANGANNDGSTGGDHIYTNHYTLAQAANNVPAISSVVNGASFQNGIASGSWVTIKGSNLSATTRNWNTSDFVNTSLPTRIDNVSVLINGLPAYVAYVSPQQLNVLAPADMALGNVQVQVTTADGTSPSVTALYQPVSPAFFLWNGKYVVATRPDNSDVAPANLFAGLTTAPAQAGDIITLWGTGFGATNPAPPGGQLVPSDTLYSLSNPLTILVGNVPAQVISAVLTPGEAGLCQIAIQIPAGTPSGDQPVTAQIAGVNSAAGAYLNVQ
jgi:uncharacterized protein (TIGR03437 family)